MTRLSPEQQLKVLAQIWGDDPNYGGYVFLPWIPGDTQTTDQRKKSWREGRAFEWPQDHEDILKHLHAHTEDDLYFTPNKFLEAARVAQASAEEGCLWADLDEVDPRSDIERDMRPTIAWETSPDRFQAIWLMEGVGDGESEPGGLNHRLTSYLGADKSGWDTTQLLRVPGRPNFKPDYRDDDGHPAPGRFLWVNSKRYSWEWFREELPEVHTVDASLSDVEEQELGHVDRHEVWARVRLRCSGQVREYMGMRERDIGEEHDRSEVLWQIERDLADAGCSILEIIAIIKHSPWNKFAGRRNEFQQLRAEAIKAKATKAKDDEDAPLEVHTAVHPDEPRWITGLAQGPIPRPNWLVHNIWSRGACGFIAAEPKSYKSYIGLDMALSVAMGVPFLNDHQFSTTQANTLFLQEEDNLALVMHRAAQIAEQKAPDRFWHGQLGFEASSPSPRGESRSGTRSELVWTPPVAPIPLAMHVRSGFVISDPSWQGWLDDFIEQHSFGLVVIDTLGTTLGTLNANDPELYHRVLNPLKDIAHKHGTAIVVIHHNRKNAESTRGGQNMTGSGSLHAWTESAMYISKDEHVTGQPATVRVDREDKLAQELKFRVKIPQMFEEPAHREEGARQLWAPFVMPGWGESEGDREVDADTKQRGKKGTTAGEAIVRKLRECGASNGRSLTLQELVERVATPSQKGNIRRQLDRAAERDLIEGTHEEGWTVLT